jgi:hypothetical protein
VPLRSSEQQANLGRASTCWLGTFRVPGARALLRLKVRDVGLLQSRTMKKGRWEGSHDRPAAWSGGSQMEWLFFISPFPSFPFLIGSLLKLTFTLEQTVPEGTVPSVFVKLHKQLSLVACLTCMHKTAR